MQNLFEALQVFFKALLPILGCFCLVVLIILIFKMYECLKKINNTLDSVNNVIDNVNESLDELKPALHTIKSLSYSVEAIHVTIEKFISNSIDKIIVNFEKIKTFIFSILNRNNEETKEKIDGE